MLEHQRVLDHFHKRLLAAVTRSSLLRATVSRTGPLLDCSRFEAVAAGLPGRVLQAVVDNAGSIPVELRLRFTHSDDGHQPDDDDEEQPESRDDRIVREHRAMYDALDRRMRRFADLIKRETGVHSLWLGYPLLYVVVGEGETRQWILAPAFLWPISIQLDHRQEGRVLIARDRNAGPAKFNRAMASWGNRQLKFDLNGPSQDEIDRLAWGELGNQLTSLANQFHDPPAIDCNAALEPVPSASLLSPQQSPRFLNSSVLGIFRWQNEAILADIDKLKNLDQIDGVCSGFVSGTRLPHAPKVDPPSEADRYQVYDADFSQERVIWQARREPGVVVHGPPGTGKSQTIVNMIADALAHGRTVLMVCQKYAATRVVFERLKQVGIDSLCIEVTDIEKSRLPVFRSIRDQVDSLPSRASELSSSRRDRLARDITRLETELDRYARAMHERDDKVGLAYRRMKTIEGEIHTRFPTVRPLPSLQAHVAAISAQELESLDRDIVEAGGLFGKAQPLTNPWRHYLPTIQVTAILHSDIHSAIERLRELDAKHVSQVGQNGAEIELIGELAALSEAAPQVISTLRGLTKNIQSPRATLLRAWIARLRASSPQTWSSHRSEIEKAIALAHEVVSNPLDSNWHGRCQHMADRQLSELAAHARATLEFEGRWTRFLSFRFHWARDKLRTFQCDANDSAVWEMARQLLAYVAARTMRAELAKLCHRIGPGLGPAHEERSQVQFPNLALDEFKRAESLCLQEHRQPWLKDFLDALIANHDAMSLNRIIDAVEKAIERLPVANALIRTLSALGTYLKPDAFTEPEQLVRTGKSISPWLASLELGLPGLQPLMAWDLSRMHRDVGRLRSASARRRTRSESARVSPTCRIRSVVVGSRPTLGGARLAS